MRIDRNKLKKIEDIYLDNQNPKLHVFRIGGSLFSLFDDGMDQPLAYDSEVIIRSKIRQIIKMISNKNKSINNKTNNILVIFYKLDKGGYRIEAQSNKEIKE